MKSFAMVVVAFSPLAALAGGLPVTPFPDAKIGIPPLSLGDAAKQATPPLLANPPDSFRSRTPIPAPSQKRVSRMPIIPPRPEIDAKLRILKPDESTDYKLIVKEPDVEPAKRQEQKRSIVGNMTGDAGQKCLVLRKSQAVKRPTHATGAHESGG